jgi:hypothetical protein
MVKKKYNIKKLEPKTKQVTVAVPNDLKAAVKLLKKSMNKDDLETFKQTPEEKACAMAHHTVGRWIRNRWTLWYNPKLHTDEPKPGIVQFFQDRGINHADDMSGIVICSLHRYLNGKPTDLEGQIAETIEFYKNNIIASIQNEKSEEE